MQIIYFLILIQDADYFFSINTGCRLFFFLLTQDADYVFSLRGTKSDKCYIKINVLCIIRYNYYILSMLCKITIFWVCSVQLLYFEYARYNYYILSMVGTITIFSVCSVQSLYFEYAHSLSKILVNNYRILLDGINGLFDPIVNIIWIVKFTIYKY